MLKLDSTFEKEIRKIANGDESREARFAFLRSAKEATRKLSTANVRNDFSKILSEYGRVTIGLCVAVTVQERKDRLSENTVRWANAVLKLWTNRPNDIFCLAIHDNLHPTRIEEYAGSFIRLTSEQV